jgi:hypothetical protein
MSVLVLGKVKNNQVGEPLKRALKTVTERRVNMVPTKYKNCFRTLCGISALFMLIFSADAYGARGHGERGHRDASPQRQQSAEPAGQAVRAERSEPAVSMPQVVGEPQQGRPEFANWQGRGERFNSNRQFDRPEVRFDRPQPQMENRNFGAIRRFDNSPPAQGMLNNNGQRQESFSNRTWAKTEPTIGQASNQAVARPDTGDKGHDGISTWRGQSPSIDKKPEKPIENNPTPSTGVIDKHKPGPINTTGVSPLSSTTRNEAFQRPIGENKHVFGRDPRAKPAPGWNSDNVSLRVVDNAHGGTAAGRTSFWGGVKNFFHHDDDHHSRFIDIPRNNFVFFGRRHHFRHHRIVGPDFFFVLSFNFGNWNTFCDVYPYYHVRYVFVNPCGYWPYGYRYMRYYWYGCYPYSWYGYYPIPYQYGDTYNYYTYNYYGSDNGPVSDDKLSSLSSRKAEQPAAATLADTYFDEGVKAFEVGDFETATAKFAQASSLAPDDKVLAFAYSQGLLAFGDYKAAARVLREALTKVNPVEEGVFYPRGLYWSDEILFNQIEILGKKAQENPNDADLQLLLGYQWLGLGELDKAEAPLTSASLDSTNGTSAKTLLQLLDKLQTEQTRAGTPEAD